MSEFSPSPLSIHVERLFLQRLGAAGMTDSLARLIIHSPENQLAADIVALLEEAACQGAPDRAL
jgi:hypothetical protein